MALFTVDAERCNKDGICAAECPMKIITWEKGKLPEPVKGADKMCINCGHCVAVCPTAALTLKTMGPDDCLAFNPEWALSPEQAEHFLRSRRSIRTYKKDIVDRDKVDRLIGIASYAPSGHNMQPVEWQVISGPDKVKEFAALVIDWMRWMVKEKPDVAKMLHLDMVVAGWEFGLDTVCRDAPMLILANGNKKNPTSQAACTIAMTYLELAAPSLGLGACWNGFFNAAAIYWPPLQEALGLASDMGNYGVMMVGYPKFKYHRMPPRNTPKVSWTD